MWGEQHFMLLAIAALGLLGRSLLTTISATAIWLLYLVNWSWVLEWMEKRGVEIGLVFLTLAMLAPFATGKINWRDVILAFTTLPGILAILGGILATQMNGRGLALLSLEPQLIIGLIVGSLIGIFFFKGVPVGPLMAGGLTAFFLQVISLIRGN